MATQSGDGDEERFRALYQQTYPAVHAYVARRISPSETPDVVAEVFATAWRSLDRIGDPPLPWLYGAAANHLAHQRRSASRRWRLEDRVRGSTVAASPDPADAVCGRLDDTALVRRVLALLPTADAEILRLWAWEQLEPADIATVLHCSAGTARVRLHRARRRMAALLAETDPDRALTPQEELT